MGWGWNKAARCPTQGRQQQSAEKLTNTFLPEPACLPACLQPCFSALRRPSDTPADSGHPSARP